MVLSVIVFTIHIKLYMGMIHGSYALKRIINTFHYLYLCVLQNNEKNMDMVIKWERDV